MVTRIKRNVFYSFHYKPDHWRVQQVRKMGALAGNAAVAINTWETIVAGGDQAIQAWIDKNMSGKSCVVVLIGTRTAGRKWINYEVEKAWNDGKGVLGIHIHPAQEHQAPAVNYGAEPLRGLRDRPGPHAAEQHRQGLQPAPYRQRQGLRLHRVQPRGVGRGGDPDPQALLTHS